MKTISLCMIVKNEEKQIEKCLLSAKDLFNEIIIVDTGSTDQTMKICEQFGATVYQYGWADDFAAARNFGLQLCQSDWIMWLDADEYLDEHLKNNLQKEIEKIDQEIIFLPIYNYFGNGNQLHKDDFHLQYQPRLFKNHIGITFMNRIHESIQLPDDLLRKEKFTLNLPIHHTGYMDHIVQSKQKSERNLKILAEQLQDNNHSPWVKYFIASELNTLKEYESSFQFLNQAIIDFIKNKIHPPSIIYKLKYDIIIKTKNWEGASKSIDKAILLYPDYVDLHYYKGCILYHTHQYKEALEAFETCLQLGDSHDEYLILHGVGSFRAQEYIAKCLEQIE